jgi:hypothetical protein
LETTSPKTRAIWAIWYVVWTWGHFLNKSISKKKKKFFYIVFKKWLKTALNGVKEHKKVKMNKNE